MTDILNRQIDLLFQYWNGEITEEEFENNKLFSISKEVDEEMQQDRFYQIATEPQRLLWQKVRKI